MSILIGNIASVIIIFDSGPHISAHKERIGNIAFPATNLMYKDNAKHSEKDVIVFIKEKAKTKSLIEIGAVKNRSGDFERKEEEYWSIDMEYEPIINAAPIYSVPSNLRKKMPDIIRPNAEVNIFL